VHGPHATTVTAVPLPPAVVALLLEQLADLPTKELHDGVPVSVRRPRESMQNVHLISLPPMWRLDAVHRGRGIPVNIAVRDLAGPPAGTFVCPVRGW